MTGGESREAPSWRRRGCSDRTASGPGALAGRLVADEGKAGARPQEWCIWPLVEFLLPKDWGYCLSPHGCPVPGT